MKKNSKEKEKSVTMICKDDDNLKSYCGLTAGKKYKTKTHANVYFLKVTNDYNRSETYPKHLFKEK